VVGERCVVRLVVPVAITSDQSKRLKRGSPFIGATVSVCSKYKTSCWCEVKCAARISRQSIGVQEIVSCKIVTEVIRRMLVMLMHNQRSNLGMCLNSKTSTQGVYYSRCTV
jgi:hypothetical protein